MCCNRADKLEVKQKGHWYVGALLWHDKAMKSWSCRTSPTSRRGAVVSRRTEKGRAPHTVAKHWTGVVAFPAGPAGHGPWRRTGAGEHIWIYDHRCRVRLQPGSLGVNAGLVVGQRLRRWPTTKPELVQRLISAGPQIAPAVCRQTPVGLFSLCQPQIDFDHRGISPVSALCDLSLWNDWESTFPCHKMKPTEERPRHLPSASGLEQEHRMSNACREVPHRCEDDYSGRKRI